MRQAAALIYSTVVPPGPFSLSNLPLLNGTNDLEVTVIEADGSSHKFIVPAASLSAGSLGIAPGYSFAVGKLRDLGDSATSKPWMATGTGTWSIGKSSSVTAGVLGATEYQSIGFGGQTTIFDRTSISAQSTWSNATREGLRGGQATASISTPITESLSFNASASLQTPGYRTLTDTTRTRRRTGATTTIARSTRHRRHGFIHGLVVSPLATRARTCSTARRRNA